MHSKTSSVHPRSKYKFHGIDSNKRLTRLFRESLSRSWVHPYIRARRFIHEYSLPAAMTAVFLIIVVAASFLRVSQRASLANLLAAVTSVGQDYGTLLSNDKTDELKKNSDNDDTVPGGPARVQTPFAINPNSSAVPSAPGGASPAPGSNPSSPGNGTVTEPVFTASIASFQQGDVALECSTPKPKQQTCSKRYSFNGSIRTVNGPGTVNYGWRSNLPAGTEDGSIAAAGGTVLTPLQKTITLACNTPTSFNMQLTIFSPALTQSTILTINHNCNEL